MSGSLAHTTPLLALLTLALACGPAADDPAATSAAEPAPKPNFSFVEVPTDPGLLLTIMHGLGRDMGTLGVALWRDDLSAVATAAQAIADHPRVAPAEAQRIQGVLGDRFPDFVTHDHQVHDSAVRLAEHAGAGDMGATVEELATLQTACIACHEAFRDELRTP